MLLPLLIMEKPCNKISHSPGSGSLLNGVSHHWSGMPFCCESGRLLEATAHGAAGDSNPACRRHYDMVLTTYNLVKYILKNLNILGCQRQPRLIYLKTSRMVQPSPSTIKHAKKKKGIRKSLTQIKSAVKLLYRSQSQETFLPLKRHQVM